MKVRTNNQWRDFMYREQVPQEILKDQFDHLDEDVCDGFFFYRNCWYHTSDFMRLVGNSELSEKWDGVASDSYFSGVLIKLSRDGEQFRVGTYLS